MRHVLGIIAIIFGAAAIVQSSPVLGWVAIAFAAGSLVL